MISEWQSHYDDPRAAQAGASGARIAGKRTNTNSHHGQLKTSPTLKEQYMLADSKSKGDFKAAVRKRIPAAVAAKAIFEESQRLRREKSKKDEAALAAKKTENRFPNQKPNKNGLKIIPPPPPQISVQRGTSLSPPRIAKKRCVQGSDNWVPDIWPGSSTSIPPSPIIAPTSESYRGEYNALDAPKTPAKDAFETRSGSLGLGSSRARSDSLGLGLSRARSGSLGVGLSLDDGHTGLTPRMNNMEVKGQMIDSSFAFRPKLDDFTLR